MCRNILLWSISMIWGSVCTAQNPVVHYYEMQETYIKFAENDERALPAVTKSIRWAKRNNNLKHLLYTYQDAAFYSANAENKLKFMDSCVQTARKTEDASLISKALLDRGIVYYFNYRNFDKALEQYLLAAQSAEYTDDDYLKFKIKYQIGVVKSYLGFYQEATQYFDDCFSFFAKSIQLNSHPTILFNNTRGYLNSLHQLIICARQLKHWEKVDELLLLVQPYQNDPAFAQEKAYFLKEQGIVAHHQGSYQKAIQNLTLAEQGLNQRKEENHLAVVYFYLGHSYLKNNEIPPAHTYLQKVDSLFSKNKTIIPEVRKSYELLLKNNAFKLSMNEVSHYTNQLLQADSIIHIDLPYLSSTIYREYDTKNLTSEKKKLLQEKQTAHDFMTILYGVIGSAVIFLVIMWYRQKKISKNYQELQRKLETRDYHLPVTIDTEAGRKMIYPDKVVSELLQKLQAFEEKKLFLDPNLTADKLARILNASKNHLSYVLNEHRKTNFHTYLGILRINYITTMMNTDPEYLKYSTVALAQLCGMKSRQNFSKLFYEINKIRPSDFVEQKRKELKTQ